MSTTSGMKTVKILKKNVAFALAVILFISNTNAQGISDSGQKSDFKCGSIIISLNNEITEYQFKSQDDLSREVESIIKDLDFNSESVKKKCEVKIEIRIEISVESTTIILTETIMTNCED